jgi:hypothetical protein
MYFDTVLVQCLPCTSPCLTCSGLATSCTSCVATYSYTPNTCSCDSTAQLFYSSVTLGCVSCATLIPNCATCNSPSVSAVCSLCSDPYYVDTISNTCVLCDITCTSCTGIGLCTACANNLVIIGPPIGYCVPNTGFDSNLVYYESTNTAVSCLILLSDC